MAIMVPRSKRRFDRRILKSFDNVVYLSNQSSVGGCDIESLCSSMSTDTSTISSSSSNDSVVRKSILSSERKRTSRNNNNNNNNNNNSRVSFSNTITIIPVHNLKLSLTREERSLVWDEPPQRQRRQKSEQEEDRLENNLSEAFDVFGFDSRISIAPQKEHKNKHRQSRTEHKQHQARTNAPPHSPLSSLKVFSSSRLFSRKCAPLQKQ